MSTEENESTTAVVVAAQPDEQQQQQQQPAEEFLDPDVDRSEQIAQLEKELGLDVDDALDANSKKQLEDEVDKFVSEMENWRKNRGGAGDASSASALVVAAAPPAAKEATTTKSKKTSKKTNLNSSSSNNKEQQQQPPPTKLPPRTRPLLFSDIVKSTLGPGHFESASSAASSADMLAGALAAVPRVDFTNAGLTDLDAFDCLPGVTHAYLGDNHIQSLEGVEVWLGCTVLVLHDNEISDIEPLFSLRGLRVLDLRRNRLAGIDAAVLPETLEVLEVAGNAGLAAALRADPAAKEELWEQVMAQCPNLRSIDVVGTREEMGEWFARKQREEQQDGEEKGAEQEQQQLKQRGDNDDDDNEDDHMLRGCGGGDNVGALVVVKNEDDDESDDDDEDDDPELTALIKRTHTNSLEAKVTDADFDEAASARCAAAVMLRPSSAGGRPAGVVVRPGSRGGGVSGRPASASATLVDVLPNRRHGNNNDGDDDDENDNNSDEVRLSLPVAGGVQSQVRNVTDDLLRQYDHNLLRRTGANAAAANAAAAAAARAEFEERQASSGQPDVLNLMDDDDEDDGEKKNEEEGDKKNNNDNQPAEKENSAPPRAPVVADESEDAFVSDQLREDSRSLRKDLLLAAQHQRRVASMKIDDEWDQQRDEFAKALSSGLDARYSGGGGGGRRAGGSGGSAYEEALKVIAKSVNTTVDGLDKFRK